LLFSCGALTRGAIRASMLLTISAMSETFQIESPGQGQQSSGRSWIAWMGVATILIALAFLMWPAGERPSSSTRESHLPFGPAEQAYAPNIRIENLALSRAENFLNQEVTTLAGHVTNTGNLPLSNVEVTVEFSDELGQVVLRESRALFAPKAPPFAPGERRDFEISFEHIPVSWNIQQPVVRVTGIVFTPKKE
jgi:hypothetical protein